MEDRIPLYPGRVKMAPVEGQPNVYDMTRADEAIRDGTPINKTNLLKDSTAEQFGLDSSAVPDDILSWLGKYNEHWWSALHGDATYEIGMSLVTTNIYIYGSTANESPEDRTLYVSKTVSVVDGALVLDDKTEYVSESRNLKPLVDEYAPCYISNLYGDPTGVYYLPEGTTVQTTAVSESKGKTIHWSSSSGAVMLASSGSPRAKTVGVKIVSPGETTYEHSLDRNAYPDSGTGMVIAKSLGAAAQVAVAGPDVDEDIETPVLYSAVYTYDEDTGKVILKNPSKLIADAFNTNAEKLRGYYFTPGDENTGEIYYADSNAEVEYNKGPDLYYCKITASPVTFSVSGDNTTFYNYLGVPFENLPGCARIETGTYEGTDVYGAGNENTLTFAFVPKVVIVSTLSDANTTYIGVFVNGNALNIGLYRTSTSSGSVLPWLYTTWNSNTLSWYSTSKAVYQLNEAATTYRYVAVG